MRELRPYQAEAIEALRQTVGQGVKRIVLQLPTGGGKTLIAAKIAEGALRKGGRLAFVVSNLSLIDQTMQAFWDDGVRDVGVIQGSHVMTDWSKPIQICSIQTLKNRTAFPEAKVVIIDEVHLLHDAHKKWLTHMDWQQTPFIGLSATPFTKGLGKYFETMIVAATPRELIDQKFLSDFKVFASGHPDLSGVKIVAGEYHEGDLSDAMQQGNLTADIVETWKNKWGKEKTLCFAVDCAHAKSIQERFEQAGVPCGYQDAKTPDLERRIVKKKFHNGEFQVVSNVDTLSVGTDWDVRCLILARPTRSEMKYIQIVGRCLRIADGKPYALILDHSDTTQRLGFVTDIQHDHLDDGRDKPKAEAQQAFPKECSNCAFLKPPRTPICPNCGHEAKRVNGVHEQDGELVEISAGAKPKRGVKYEFTAAEKGRFLAELKAYAAGRDYKAGWPAVKFKDKFGHWPDWSIRDISAAAYPTASTVMWIKSRNIAYARAKEKAGEQSSLQALEKHEASAS